MGRCLETNLRIACGILYLQNRACFNCIQRRLFFVYLQEPNELSKQRFKRRHLGTDMAKTIKSPLQYDQCQVSFTM